MTPDLAERLGQYLHDRDETRHRQADERFDRLSHREQWLVQEAAVMGYVQGVRSQPGGHRAEIPHDKDIVRLVIEHCASFPDLYPLLGGDLRDVVWRMLKRRPPVRREDLADAIAQVTDRHDREAAQAVQDLIDDETLREPTEGLVEWRVDED